ncbi:MAG TPA: hypothetical protein VIX82_02320, partial [Solirubrobacteraceae bacterium]
HTLKAGVVGPGSNYAITYRFRFPGVYAVRVVFRGDFRNVRGASDPVAVTLQQAQKPGFTINSSDPIINDGQTVKISGVLDQPGTTTAEPSTPVTLFARAIGGTFMPIAGTTTGADGSYSFTQMPQNNTIYQVRTTFAPHRDTASLYQGVRDVLTLVPSGTAAKVGQTITLNGTVLPDKAGDVVYLQRLGQDGDWHNVELGIVRSNSSFTFSWTFGNPGTAVFRARIPGDPLNVGGASPRVTIAVTAPPTPVGLPPAS